MQVINPELNVEIRNMILDGLSPDAEIRPALDPTDIGVIQKQDGKIVNYYHHNPNDDNDISTSCLGILAVDAAEKRTLTHSWEVMRWSAEESLVGVQTVEIEYVDRTKPSGLKEFRVSNDPDRTYKALARLAKIHLNGASAKSA